ncbi:hypothetical protein BAE44_0021421 [Dichanthelium oligosanthes]|uniref:Uncharacterized protein n=1 Tax=Dichanthelium oligosanthes TaxID=888268 RepID=A0A1E5UXI0_9POAL|nr:hypothetical protein BAE44_0021421 [Dichanthelium oligosanthes]
MPVAARGGLALVCAGAVCLLNAWLFAAGVAALVVARAACGVECPDVLLLVATTATVTALSIALLGFVAVLLQYHYVLDSYTKEQMAAATREALDVGSTVSQLGELASMAFVSIGLVAFFVKVYPPLKGSRLERISTVALDAGSLCTSALCCFIVIPIFAVRMLRRIWGLCI